MTLAAFGAGAEAQPLVATYTGYVLGTPYAFTAAFHYDTRDLTPSPGNENYLDAKPGTIQWATYSDPFHDLSFADPTAFSKGEYDSVVYDENGDGGVAGIDTVHDYSISGSSGTLALTFGGANDMGIVTFGTDGLDYAELDPRFFQLSKDDISAVPLPPAAPLFGGAVALLGLLCGARMRKTRVQTN